MLEKALSLSLPREHELPLRKFYSITLVFILVPLLSILELESDARQQTGVIFLMNLNGLVAATHFAEEERNFKSNDD